MDIAVSTLFSVAVWQPFVCTKQGWANHLDRTYHCPSKNGLSQPACLYNATILFYHFLFYNSILQNHLFSCISRFGQHSFM